MVINLCLLGIDNFKERLVMSANLCWRPVQRSYETLPDDLKFILRDRCGLTSARRGYGGNDLEFLRGLDAAGIKGAAELIEAIEKYGEIELWLDY